MFSLKPDPKMIIYLLQFSEAMGLFIDALHALAKETIAVCCMASRDGMRFLAVELYSPAPLQSVF